MEEIELDRKQVKKDLENWGKKMQIAMKNLVEIYNQWQELYEAVNKE